MGEVRTPLISAAISGSRLDAGPPSRSSLSRHGPRRRDGSPSGDVSAPPALSLRGCGATALNWPHSAGRRREVSFPSLVIPVGDEGEFTNVVLRWSKWSVPNCVRPSDVARGLAWDPLTLAWDLSTFHTQPILNRLGCVSQNVPRIAMKVTALRTNWLQQTSTTHELSSTLCIYKARLNFTHKAKL